MLFDENYNIRDDVCINESSFIGFNLFGSNPVNYFYGFGHSPE